MPSQRYTGDKIKLIVCFIVQTKNRLELVSRHCHRYQDLSRIADYRHHYTDGEVIRQGIVFSISEVELTAIYSRMRIATSVLHLV